MNRETVVAREVAGGVMVTLGLLLAFWQDAAPLAEGANSNLVAALVNALTLGGGFAVAGAFLLKRIDRYLDARDAAATRATLAASEAASAEREEERAERERIHRHGAELMAHLIAQQKATETQLLAQVEAWREACQTERGRSDTLVLQFVDRMSCSIPPPSG